MIFYNCICHLHTKAEKTSLQRVQSHMTSLVNLCLKRMNTHFLKNLRALKLAIDRCNVCKAVTPKGILFLVYHCKDIYQASAIYWSCNINVLVFSKNYQGKLVFEVATKILTTVELLPWSRICSYKRNLYPINNDLRQ